MTEEEKKAIKKLKEYALCKVDDKGFVEISANGYKYIILNLIQKQDTEINKLNNVIDRMAEVLNNQDIEYLDLCDNCKNNNEDCHGDYCKERIKEYFMKEDK